MHELRKYLIAKGDEGNTTWFISLRTLSSDYLQGNGPDSRKIVAAISKRMPCINLGVPNQLLEVHLCKSCTANSAKKKVEEKIVDATMIMTACVIRI